MYLKRSITANWGNLPVEEMEYGPINLFSGGNGSGKTTAADALQTLMTAAHDNLFNYNPGQDETTQRGRGGKQVRTLASYVLGCDDGAFARPWTTDGYIAGVFHPTQGETAEPFTAVIGVRAHLDTAGSSRQARQDELLLMIVPGEMLALSDFVRDTDDGRHVIPLTELPNLLRKQFGKQGVETYDRKSAYLARLYGALRGKGDAVSIREAKNAARTFANFMAYKPVRSIDQFVAGEVLEAREFGDTIKRIRDLLRTVHGMEQEAARVRGAVGLLEQSRQLTEDYQNSWLERIGLDYAAAAQNWSHNRKQYVAAKDKQQEISARIDDLTDEQQLNDERTQQAHRDLVQLEARRQGIPALQGKDDLENRQQLLTARLQQGVAPLLEQAHQRDLNLEAVRTVQHLVSTGVGVEIPELTTRNWKSLADEILAAEQQPVAELHQLLSNDWIDLSPLHHGLDNVRQQQQTHNRLATLLAQPGTDGISLLQRVDRLSQERAGTLANLERQITISERQIKTLQQSRVIYPIYVEDALAAIRQQCPEADPRVLCDHVEVTDPDWQMSIEGYLGGSRFGILVEPAHEAEAIRIVRQLSARDRNRARVIQGDKARQDAERLSLPKDSVVHVLRFSHRVAEHYVRASYASLVRVNDAAGLRQARRGITREGMGSGNYSMFRCDIDDSQLVFGVAARERNLRAQQKQLEELQLQRHALRQFVEQLKHLAAALQRIKPLDYLSQASQLLEQRQQLQDIEQQLASLDLSAFHDVEQELDRVNERHAELVTRQSELQKELGGLNVQLTQINQRIRTLSDQGDALQEQREEAEQYLLEAAARVTGLDPQQRLTQIDEMLTRAGDDFDFAADSKSLTDSLYQLAVALDRGLKEYNQQAQPADNLIHDTAAEVHSLAFFEHVCGLRQQLDNLHNRLRNNVLLEKQEQLIKLRDSFNSTFITDLCHEIHQAINDGGRTLEGLNTELQHHRFGADRESFQFEWSWVPEYKEYWEFFREVTQMPNLGDGASLFDAHLSGKGAAVRDQLLGLLLDGDEQQALRELERISDYRRYRRYDILKHPEGKAPIRLSEYGTGSGGQLETPAYIIRAAAVTSAFRFNEGDSHLRMVIVDEAFMHMDETRSREVINYLTETLGLQLIFIMPTSKAGPFLELISNQFVFSKVPSPRAVGELNTRVLLDRQQLNRERITELWANHRRVIRQQGALDFMEMV
ncbi:ATP-binding protein [Halopseudomonas bauzanensis]|uniref:p-loop containing region of AAA domain-containing protein n=1 Tax=Halopseudomonas bauzanensis TaxID=653930 RepID=A0A1H9WKS5_9GAMM|nr:SbcC/MukB-like Walker B domain-containing protein [Halopseudomonas bauzanensis]SES34465.1 P-loop containing region of AAA domain-containing protein [Halopseudomonas bauzanensis]SFM36680.1 P-loop containing region of AAA domain-containing protein [Halopseudomonas bauzanensis]